MTKFLEYQKDLEDAFKLDCSEEDLKTDKDAKRCFKVIKKYRKQTQRYYDFLCKFGFVYDSPKVEKIIGEIIDMSSNRRSNGSGATGGGLGLGSVLTIVFVVLKLVGVINWSWLWVLSPLWISIALTLIILAVAFVIALICALNDRR